MTCIVNKKSLFYLNPQLTRDEQAQKMAKAYAKNGTNFQYLKRALKIYRDYGLNDSCTAELEDLYAKIISCCQNLPINDPKWLDIYDELQTLEER